MAGFSGCELLHSSATEGEEESGLRRRFLALEEVWKEGIAFPGIAKEQESEPPQALGLAFPFSRATKLKYLNLEEALGGKERAFSGEVFFFLR